MTARLAFAPAALAAIPCLALLALGAREATPADDFGLTDLGGLAFLLAALVFAAIGSLLVARVPGNLIGRLFCVTGVLVAIGDLSYQYADYALYVSDRSLAGGTAAAWLQNLAVPPAFGLLGISLLVFPDGRLLSRRWRPVLWLATVGILAIVAVYALRTGPLDEPFEGISNPFGIDDAYGLIDAASSLGWILMGASLVLAAASVAVRLRHAHGRERQQIKWIVPAASVAGLVFGANVASFLIFDRGAVAASGLALAAFPAATGVSILRHRLYDIDLVINRTLVYGALSATLGLSYLAGVLVLGQLFAPLTRGSDLAIAGSTLAVAALFRPLRGRIQAAVDRRFYRHRYDAARTLEGFSARLREQVDLDALGGELQAVVRETMAPAHVSLWLRASPGARIETERAIR